MKRIAAFLFYACIAMAGGCGAQGMLLGTEGSYLLTGADVLALPNETVQLQARLQGGDFLRAKPGHVVRFSREGKLFKATETDADGLASVSFTAEQAGDYRFVADVAGAGLSDAPPEAQDILVTCRPADTAMLIVDLDKTVVASGFHTVLIGNPAPMSGSAELLRVCIEGLWRESADVFDLGMRDELHI